MWEELAPHLPESLEGFPDADRLAESMRRSGLVGVSYRRLSLGAVALHVGTVPQTVRTASPAG